MPVGRGKKNLHNMETSSDTERDAMAVTLWVPVGLYVVLYPDRKFASGTRRGSLPSTFSPAGTSSLGPCCVGAVTCLLTPSSKRIRSLDLFSASDRWSLKAGKASGMRSPERNDCRKKRRAAREEMLPAKFPNRGGDHPC